MSIFSILGRSRTKTENPDDLFTDKSESQIVSMIRSAQTGQIKAYNEVQRILHDLCDGEISAAATRHLSVTHPNEIDAWGKAANGIPVGLSFLNLVERIVRDLACVYHSSPQTYLINANGQRLQDDDPQTIQWRIDSEAMDFNSTLRRLDRYTVLFRTVLTQVSWVGGRMVWSVLEPYVCTVRQSSVLPSEIMPDTAITVELGQRLDTVRGPTTAKYQTWAGDRTFIHRSDATLSANSLFSDNVNRYRDQSGAAVIPFVVVRENEPRSGQFWLHPRTDWVSVQMKLIERMTDEAHALKLQAHGQPVATGIDPGQALATGPGKLIALDDPASSFEYKQAGANFNAMDNAIDSLLRRVAVSTGQAASMWTTEGSTRNLGSLKLERHGLTQRRSELIPVYDAAIKKMFAVHKIVSNYHAETEAQGRIRYEDGVSLVVRAAPLQLPTDTQAEAQARTIEISQGLSSVVDEISAQRGVTKTEAEEIYRQNLVYRDMGTRERDAGEG